MYRRTSLPSIWREMDRLQHEMNRLFDRTIRGRVPGAPTYPAVNIWANDDGQVIIAEMPGVDLDDIEIDVTADTLTLSGKRARPSTDDGVQIHRAERAFGEFTRKIQLPFMVDPEKAKASFKDGILQISIPRAEADKPRKITVKRGK